MWAVPGTDTCLKHGGKIPQTIAEANERVAKARASLRKEDRRIFAEAEASTIASITQIGYGSTVPLKANSIKFDRVLPMSLIRERIETKIEEFREAAEDYPYEFGIQRGLELALELLET